MLWKSRTGPATMPRMDFVDSVRTRFYWRDGRMAAMAGVVILLTAIVVAGVKVYSSTGTASSQPQHFVPPPAETAQPTPTPDPVKVAIIKGYEDATAAFVHAATTGNPNDPALPATALGVEEVTEVTNLQRDAALHIISRGYIKPGHPHVDSISRPAGSQSDQAQVSDCRLDNLNAYDVRTGVAVNARTGAPLPPGQQTPGADVHERIVATLGNVDGVVWKLLTEHIQVVDSCPAA